MIVRPEKSVTLLDLAFHLLGGPYGIAGFCGISKRGAALWKIGGFPCDARGRQYAAKIEACTGGRVNADLLFDECTERKRAAKSDKKS